MKPYRWQRKVNERRFQNHAKSQEAPPQIHIPDGDLTLPDGVIIDLTPEQAEMFSKLVKRRVAIHKARSVGTSTMIHASFMGAFDLTAEELEAAYEIAAKGNRNDPA